MSKSNEEVCWNTEYPKWCEGKITAAKFAENTGTPLYLAMEIGWRDKENKKLKEEIEELKEQLKGERCAVEQEQRDKAVGVGAVKCLLYVIQHPNSNQKFAVDAGHAFLDGLKSDGEEERW